MSHARTEGRFSAKRRVRRAGKAALLVPKWLIARAHRWWVDRSPHRAPRILLVAQNDLMAQYVMIAGELVADRSRLFLYAPTQEYRSVLTARRGLPVAGGSAPWHWWDLIVVAEHLPFAFPRTGPVVLLSHGLVRAGAAPRGSFLYDSEKVLRWGRPVYDAICDASHRSAEFGESLVPSLSGRVHVTGDLRVDRMLASTKVAEAQDRPRLVVMSTWGADCLFERHGDELFEGLLELHHGGVVDVTVTCHPNLWQPQTSLQDWPALLKELSKGGIRVVRPDQPWEPVLACADIALSDHTSLCGTFAVLRRPIVPVICLPDGPEPGTFFDALIQAVPPLEGMEDLRGAIERSLRNGFPESLEDEVAAMAECLGESSTRVRAVLLDLLGGERM